MVFSFFQTRALRDGVDRVGDFSSFFLFVFARSSVLLIFYTSLVVAIRLVSL